MWRVPHVSLRSTLIIDAKSDPELCGPSEVEAGMGAGEVAGSVCAITSDALGAAAARGSSAAV